MKKFGLIGTPLKHSFSQGYFKNKFEEENILNSEYNNYEIDKVSGVRSLIKKEKNICGLNVTIPYKEQVIPYLDNTESIAKEIGSVNVINKENKKLIGYNTDYVAFMYSLKLWLPNLEFSSVVLGTGGSSKAIKYALKELNIPSLFVSRTPTSSELSYDELLKGDVIKNNKLIINTTPVGMFPNINSHPSFNFKFLSEEHYVYDLIYNPEITLFLKLSKDNGSKIKNGYDMLVKQAELSWKIWNK